MASTTYPTQVRSEEAYTIAMTKVRSDLAANEYREVIHAVRHLGMAAS